MWFFINKFLDMVGWYFCFFYMYGWRMGGVYVVFVDVI